MWISRLKIGLPRLRIGVALGLQMCFVDFCIISCNMFNLVVICHHQSLGIPEFKHKQLFVPQRTQNIVGVKKINSKKMIDHYLFCLLYVFYRFALAISKCTSKIWIMFFGHTFTFIACKFMKRYGISYIYINI